MKLFLKNKKNPRGTDNQAALNTFWLEENYGDRKGYRFEALPAVQAV